MTVVYVCGYGRSGSTLLGRVLAADQRAVAVGEVTNMSSVAFLANSLCSCGRPYPTCAYWAEVHQRLAHLSSGKDPLSQRRRRFLEGLPGVLLPLSTLRRLVRSAAFSERYPGVPFDVGVRILAEAASTVAVVDISKTTRLTANRARLLRASGQDVELHLPWRSLSDVIASYRAAHARRGDKTLWWTAALAVTVGRLFSLLAAVWSATSLGVRLHRTTFDQVMERAARQPADDSLNHMIAGNRSRLADLDRGDSTA